jgi:prophage regulatory protein
MIHTPVRNPLVDIDTSRGLMGGVSRAGYYAQAAAGLMPKPVKIGPRRSALPANEIEALNAAKIAGASEDDLRALVSRLHAQRATAA